MSAVVVGYVPSLEGQAALEQGIEEARLRGAQLVVVNSSRGDVLADPRFASDRVLDQVRAKLDRAGVVYEIDQRVADKLHVDTRTAIEGLFEREDHQHTIGDPPHRLQAARPPRPQLRADVVDHRHAELGEFRMRRHTSSIEANGASARAAMILAP